MAERIGTTLADALKKRRNSTGTDTTPAKQPHISTRSPTTTPRRRRSTRMSVVASSSVQVEAAVEVVVEGEQATVVVASDSVASTGGAPSERVATVSSKQPTPSTPGEKYVQSSSGSPSLSSSARRRRPSQTPQSVSQSLGKPSSSASKQPTGEKDTEEAEEEPESEPLAPQLSSRQLQFTDSDEETDSDAQPNEASQDSDYMPERAFDQRFDQSQTDESEENERDEAKPEATGAALPSRMKPRRRTKFWEPEEEEFLRKGVQKHGLGKWKLILLEGKGVFSNHRTNVDLKDKWKNLLQRTGEPREKRKVPATPAATESVEIDISDNEGFTASPVPPLPVRELKKRRTAAVVANASFAAVRTAELSPSQSQSQKDSKEIERYRSPQIDHSYEVEDVMEDSEREKEEEHGTPEPKSKASTSASRKKETSESEPEVPEPEPTSKIPEPKATTAVPKTKTPAPKAKVHAAKSKAVASKIATPGSSLEPRTTVSDFVKFEFASDKTFPKKLSMQVNLKQCRTIGMLKDRARKYLLRDIPEDVSVQLLGISSRRLVDDDEDTETCFKKFGHDYYFVY